MSVPDPAVTDWVPLGSIGVGGSLLALQDIVLSADGPIDFQNIPQSYKSLRLIAALRSAYNGVTDGSLGIQFNAQAALHDTWAEGNVNGVWGSLSGANVGQVHIGVASALTAPAGAKTPVTLDLLEYATSEFKSLTFLSGVMHQGLVGYTYHGMGLFRSATPVTRLTITNAVAGVFKAGSRATLYGLAAPGVTLLPTGVRAIWGRVAGNGAILGGTGFSVNRTGAGQYTISFNTPFNVAPAVVANTNDSVIQADAPLFISTPAVNGVTIFTTTMAAGGGSNFVDHPFSFIAMEAA
jgi:hypothetical protein